VQEGKPLYGGDTDHSMDEAERSDGASASASRQLHHDCHSHHQAHGGHSAPGPSSLAKAAGGSLPIRPRHISTKLVVEEHHTHHERVHHYHRDGDADEMACSPPRKTSSSPLQMRLVVGGETQNQFHETHYNTHASYPQQHPHVATHTAQTIHYDYEPVERMEGVEHQGVRGPLVVMDGANIAYAYADAMSGFSQGNTEPDARGIQVAANYFLSMDVRVLVVIPAPWFRVKPRTGDESQGMHDTVRVCLCLGCET
jgi:hypothetical protein